MRSPIVLLSTSMILATGLVGAASASADVVSFSPGEGTYLRDGKVGCVVGVSDDGKGSVTCSGPDVYSALWSGTSCEERTSMGCVGPRGLRSIGLGERGRVYRDTIDGVGGAKDANRGDTIVVGGIRGKQLTTGGYSFTNRSGHGFTLTNQRLRRF